MGKQAWAVSQDEWKSAFNGLRLQAKAFGLEVNTEEMRAFIMHEADVISGLQAEVRYLNYRK